MLDVSGLRVIEREGERVKIIIYEEREKTRKNAAGSIISSSSSSSSIIRSRSGNSNGSGSTKSKNKRRKEAGVNEMVIGSNDKGAWNETWKRRARNTEREKGKKTI